MSDFTIPLQNDRYEAVLRGLVSGLSIAEAGYLAGYAKRTARGSVGRWITRPEVQPRLAYLHALEWQRKANEGPEPSERTRVLQHAAALAKAMQRV